MPNEGRLYARPAMVTQPAPTGLQPLNIGSKRDGYMYVSHKYHPEQPSPLVLLLHGVGGHAHHGIGLLQHLADNAGLILVAPASTSHTWDVIANKVFGPDVAIINQSLEYVCNNYAIDPGHLVIGGFSDGASYALSLGLTNGDIITHVIAFSPGFMKTTVQRGQPHIFISHGLHDEVLPIASCSRRIVPHLQDAGYDVDYREFDGGHVIPPEIAQAAVNWLTATEVA